MPSAEGARIEAPKAPREVGSGKGVSPCVMGEGSGEGAQVWGGGCSNGAFWIFGAFWALVLMLV